MSSMAEELMSAGAGLGIGLFGGGSFGFWLYALVFAGAIQLAVIITRSEHYLDAERLTLAQGMQFNVLHFFAMGFVRNLIIIVAVTGIVMFVRRLFF